MCASACESPMPRDAGAAPPVRGYDGYLESQLGDALTQSMLQQFSTPDFMIALSFWVSSTYSAPETCWLEVSEKDHVIMPRL